MLTPHPAAGGFQPGATAAHVDDRYALLLVTRCTVAGIRYRVGTRLKVPADKLRVAAHLVKCGAARPLDRRTELDVELHLALDAAMPR